MSRLLAALACSAILVLIIADESVSAQEQANAVPLTFGKVAASIKGDRTAATKAAATERALYTLTINLIEREWESNHISRVAELLEETRDSKYRGFEWGYWNRLCHLERMTLTGHDGLTVVACSRDGKRLLTGGWEDRSVKIRDAVTGKVTLTLKAPEMKGDTWGINSAAFSPNGTRIASGSEDNTAKVWEVSSGKEVRTLKGHAGAIKALAFFPDGRRLVTGSMDSTARVWDIQTGNALYTMQSPGSEVYAVTVPSDGRHIVTGGRDGDARIWDGATGLPICALPGQSGAVAFALTLSPDGRRAVTRLATARLWDAQSGREIGILRGVRSDYFPVAFSPDSARVVIGGVDGVAKLYDAETGKETLTLTIPRSRFWITHIAFSRGGKGLVIRNADNPVVFLSDAENGSVTAGP